MHTIFQALADQPLLLLFLVVGVGALAGRVSVRGVSLGAAAVLFTAIGLAAWGVGAGVTLAIPEVLGSLGLALFAFVTGISAGPNFFHALRTAYPLMTAVAVLLVIGAGTAVAVGRPLGLDAETVAGTFAGALTSTPALAAAGGTPAATVGYSVTYLFGVVGMLAVTSLALRYRAADTDAPSPVVDRTVRVERTDNPTVAQVQDRHGGQLRFSRIRRSETGPAEPVPADTVLHTGDVVTVVGPATVVAALVAELGHLSSHDLVADRRDLDHRRMTISSLRHAGRTVAQLGLERQFHATVVRVRRGDVDMVAVPDLVLQLGDRVRVVAPRAAMDTVTRYLGDSARGLTDLNPAALGLGLVAGLLLGAVPVPLPGGETFAIGAAAGTMIAGLVLGRIGRIGPVVTSLPQTAAAVLSEIGLLVFMTSAGVNAGSHIIDAFASGDVLSILAVGVVVTLVVGLAAYALLRWGLHVGGTRLSGILAGMQTQTALLAYANGRTAHDPRVALGYALVYPMALIVKILCAHVLAGL
ncbi:aspartate:alanine exchanger family transporter [Georgenia sp. SYP-B2076]|uniref:aspartate:alanine exchanger family transporter n=1 Tax=Georgenia sp. SYP-B2076 TaxID=2495881 RepID=UPI000F8E32A1|nr:TrkA C-terminal domain-containing protein [Georgenia sp. SYP-B2076]